VDGYSESFDHFRAGLKGKLDNLEFNNYIYRDIVLDAVVTERVFDGSVSSDNEDLRMDLLGRFDFSDSIPELDFSLNLLYADLYALNIDPNDSTSNLSMLLTANVLGNKIDNLSGEVRMLNSRLSRFGEDLELYDASLSARQDSNDYRIDIQSDFVDAEISGDYKISEIGGDLKKVLYTLAPSLAGREDLHDYVSENRFLYSVEFKDSDKLNKFFNTGLLIAPRSKIYGELFPDSKISVHSQGDYISYQSNSLIDYRLDAEMIDSTLSLNINSFKANLSGRIDLDSIRLTLNTLPDSLRLDVDWQGSTNNEKGQIAMAGKILRTELGNPLFKASFYPSEIDVKENKWNIEESTLSIDSTSVLIDKFRLFSSGKYILVDGKISEDPLDTLLIDFNKLDLSVLNSVKKQDIETKEDKIDFNIAGELNGKILLTNLYNSLMFESDILVENFKTNEHEHGDVILGSEWNNTNKTADIRIYNNVDGNRTFDIDGYYDPQEQNLNLATEVDRIPLDILNLVLFSFASCVTSRLKLIPISEFGSGKLIGRVIILFELVSARGSAKEIKE